MRKDFSINQAPEAISELFYKSDKFSLVSTLNVYPYIYRRRTNTHTHTHTELRKAFMAGNILTPALVLLAAHRPFNKNMLWLC